MTLQVQTAEREFAYNGVALKDPNASHSIEQVREFYSAIYPELVNAAIEGPENKGNKLVYTFARAVGTKGADEPADLLPGVKRMLATDGLYIGGDIKDPSLTIPFSVHNGIVHSVRLDEQLDPTRFVPTLTFFGPFRAHMHNWGTAQIHEERIRQVNKEGWSAAHDDSHDAGDLAAAAAAYALNAACELSPYDENHLEQPPIMWPWDASWWKPRGALRDLVRAGALIAAEIDRITRDRSSVAADEPAAEESKSMPWSADIHGGDLVVRVPIATLKFAIEQGSGAAGILSGAKVHDADALAAYVADHILEFDQDESGTSALGRLIDAIAINALEDDQPFITMEDGNGCQVD